MLRRTADIYRGNLRPLGEDPGGVRSAAVEPSSADLHPHDGARYVFERINPDVLQYEVAVYLPAGESYRGRVGWGEAGGLLLELDCEHAWVRIECEKLARVVKRTGKARLSRWRPGESP